MTTPRCRRHIPREPCVSNTLIDIYLQEYEVRQFRVADARGRVKHVRDFFGDTKPVTEITTSDIRRYQVARRQRGAAAATVNRETSALSRMFHLAVQLGWVAATLTFPERLRENPPRRARARFERHARTGSARRSGRVEQWIDPHCSGEPFCRPFG